MLPHLNEIEEDIQASRKRAVTEGWQGDSLAASVCR